MKNARHARRRSHVRVAGGAFRRKPDQDRRSIDIPALQPIWSAATHEGVGRMRLTPRALAVATASLLLPPSLVVIAPMSPASAATSPRYTITELGPLSGGTASFANGINNAGVVVGSSRDAQY